MKKTIFVFFLITALSGCTTGGGGSAVSAQSTPAQSAAERCVLELINIERAKNSGDPLVWNDTLASISRAHCEDMLRNNFLKNTSSDGSNDRQWAERAGIGDDILKYSSRVLVYRGDNTPEQMVHAWRTSSTSQGGLSIMSQSYNCVGIAIVPRPAGSTDRNAAYWTVFLAEMPKLRFVKPQYTDVPVTAVSARYRHYLAVRTDGTLWAWGQNFFGELGDGTTTERYYPVQAGTANNWASLTTGINDGYSLAVKKDGTLWAFGPNFHGQLGDGTRESRKSPVQIGTDKNWASVSAGTLHTLAVKTDGTLWAWGSNEDDGAFGAAAPVISWVPIQIGTDKNWASVSAGSGFSFGIKTDGTLWGWGHFQVLDSLRVWRTIFKRNTPVQIGAANNWATVSANLNHVVALGKDGTLWAFGGNVFGQLGIGSNDDYKSSLVQVGTDRNWALASAGSLFTAAVKTDGTLWTWGNNDLGQLGNGATSARNPVPVKTGTDSNWKSVSAGDNRTAAVKTDGTLWTWGENYLGKGDGTGTSNESYSPVRVMP